MEQLKLTILSPEKQVLLSQNVVEATLPGSEGQIQILPGHAHMIGLLETGVFKYQIESGKEPVAGAISTGFFEIENDQLRIFAETVEISSEIDVQRAARAQQKAETVLQSPDLDEHQFKKYQLKLQRALIRQQVAGKLFH